MRSGGAWVPEWKTQPAPLATQLFSVSNVAVPANGRASALAGTLVTPAGYTHIGFATVYTANGDNVVATATLQASSSPNVYIHVESKWSAALTVSAAVRALYLRT